MVNNLLVNEQSKKIQGIIEKLFESFPPCFDNKQYLLDIAKQKNINVVVSNLQDVSGVLNKGDNDQWEIIVNAEESQTRQLFSLAHELGHYFLHRDKKEYFIDGGIYRDEECKNQEQEHAANEFAGQLIMPKSLIEKQLETEKTVNSIAIKNLARLFSVSTIAMATRLKNLEYTVN